ncbi:replication initiator protein/RepA-like protein [Staphylococcus saprophyticus]|uniref:replication initiator protein A n=1 Tax=Staphylococcus TaxID=1279 RepID=UPI00062BF1D8|nr:MULTISPECIES: replication initiator protein A [Staphylococcus]CRV35607.1 replication initiator protein A [Streptococcus equi subsp. equi]MBN6756803.1 replication initiator protein A [Staphylococcus saprophyticus]MBN6766786.1 replication initiator protein A [Staphylococcus saprophyticus]MBN6771615.1 replication initiator protein A [Staphylococcus saprophyticus]MBN6781306.1 replication initiator protein A [Staphylococcus saprophyticus]
MSNFKKISASEFETLRFYQLPKFLFEDEYFSKMPTEAKVMYALLKDRFELSRLNNWVDSENNIYLLYTNKQLCAILNYAEPKIIKLKKELEKYNLIINERQGLNKPNRIYLLEPTYDKELINFKFQNKENISSGTNESSVQELTNSKSNDTKFNNTDYIETENNDTNDLNDTNNNISTTNNHSNHTNHQNIEFNNDALKFQLLEELPNQIKDYLSNFEIREIRIIKSVLLKGKKSFNNAHDTYYRLEDVEFELVSVLKRFKAMLLQKNETVEAMQGYLMQSIKAELEEIHALNMRRQNMTKYNIFNE